MNNSYNSKIISATSSLNGSADGKSGLSSLGY